MSRARHLCVSEKEAREYWPEIPLGKAEDMTKISLFPDCRLTPIYRAKAKRASFVCQCWCGKWTLVTSDKLKRGETKSCGCLHSESVQEMGKKYGKSNGQNHAEDISGQIFNNSLLALEPTTERSGHDIVWKFKCLHCGNIFKSNKNNVKRGLIKSCGCLGSSVGEKIIAKILEKNNIEYEEQKTFADLVGKGNKKLRYDFYLPNQNILIEYDGIQHFESGHFKQTELEFQEAQQRDVQKNSYAVIHNIKLYRIPYNIKLKDITTLLDEKFLIKECDSK